MFKNYIIEEGRNILKQVELINPNGKPYEIKEIVFNPIQDALTRAITDELRKQREGEDMVDQNIQAQLSKVVKIY